MNGKKPKLTESQKGKIAQDLLAQVIVIGSLGKINVALPSVDDEAIDLIFYLRGESKKVLFAQVKSRWSSSQGIKNGTFKSQVRKATFHPRDNYYMFFIICDEERLQLGETLWLVPSLDFDRLTQGQHNSKRIVFDSKYYSNDMWRKFRLNLQKLPSQIEELLESDN